MGNDYLNYEPLVLGDCTIEALKSPDYERFIHAAATEPGVRLVLARRRRRPDWPFIDTKFNPNTGADLPDDAYNVLYAWFLGRGTESLAEHLPLLDSLSGLAQGERDEARAVFATLIDNMADASVRVAEANNGVCAFRVNRQYQAVDQGGRPITVKLQSAGNIFCGKGLVAAGSADRAGRGVRMLLDVARCLRENTYDSDQAEDQPQWIGQGGKMLWLAAAPLVCRKLADPAVRAAVLDQAAEFIEFILDNHYDSRTDVFSEFIDIATGQRLSYLDPGHAAEFAGLGLGAVEAMLGEATWLTPRRRDLITRARREMPRILLRSFKFGWNQACGGLSKSVDTSTGRPIDPDLPWWGLPEAMRSAVRAMDVTSDTETRRQLLECFRLCHNAYFGHFVNRGKMLFPHQTRSGATGRVLDKVPAVPEGDPLFHANLSFLDMLAVIRRLK